MKGEKMHSDITQKSIDGAKAKGMNTDEVVYSICTGDIIECITNVYEEKALSLSDDKLNELIEKGIKATEWISWSDTIEGAL
jgi:hypothetical protein